MLNLNQYKRHLFDLDSSLQLVQSGIELIESVDALLIFFSNFLICSAFRPRLHISVAIGHILVVGSLTFADRLSGLTLDMRQ